MICRGDEVCRRLARRYGMPTAFATVVLTAILVTGCQDDESCGTLQAEWEEFVADHRACSTASDCTVVASTGTCDCAPALGEGSGDVISVDATQKAQIFLDRYESCLQQSGFDSRICCDCGPVMEFSCSEGICVGQEAPCGGTTPTRGEEPVSSIG